MTIAVFCGSSLGSSSSFVQRAQQLGKYLALKQIELVYGGGKVGLMGATADAVLGAGGRVTGVIPIALKNKELAHSDLTQLIVVPDMHTRKAKMAELADAFVAMPGGSGTLEELCEMWTWAQLGFHRKPCALYNVEGYFDRLLEFIDHMVECEFLRSGYRHMLQVGSDPAELVASILAYEPPIEKWA